MDVETLKLASELASNLTLTLFLLYMLFYHMKEEKQIRERFIEHLEKDVSEDK